MLFGLLSKLVGAIYRIPLTSILTAEGMGLYQMVFPLYSLLLTLSSSGLPSSISKLVSENMARNNFRQAERTLVVSFVLLLCFSVVGALLTAAIAQPLASAQGNKAAYVCYLGLAPSIVFVGLISGFRGYFQGMERMTPSAVSGFIEQFFKLIFGLFFAIKLKHYGLVYSVLGAVAGVSVSELCALAYLAIVYACSRKKRKDLCLASIGEVSTVSKTTTQILRMSLMVTLGGLIMPLSLLIDSVVTINILRGIGYSAAEATTLFGLETGSVDSIVSMPVVLSLAVATAILPCVSRCLAAGDKEGASQSASKAIQTTLMLALPAFVGCLALAEPILRILYGRSLSCEQIRVATSLLEIASVSIFYLALLQVSSGLLHGLGCFCIPFVGLACGGVVKLVLSVILLRIPSINIMGGEVASAACYAVALSINLGYLAKKRILTIKPRVLVLIPTCASIYFSRYLFAWLNLSLNLYIAFMLTVFVVVVLYFAVIFVTFRDKSRLKACKMLE